MVSPAPPPAPKARGTLSDRGAGMVLLAAAALAAFLLYRPDTEAPFEIIDFSETLPFLTDGQDFGERFRGLVGYYLQHGRAAFGLSAGLAAKWTVFGWWTPGWQWTRYFVGLAVVVLAWRLLRTLGANRVGAAAGAALFVVSETVAPGWLRPALNEPFGTLVLLGASLLACRYQSSTRPARLAMMIAILLALLVVVKETLVAAVFLPLALALCRGADGMLDRPAWSARNRMLVASSVVAIALVSVPVVWALTQATDTGYARQFGTTDDLLSNALFGILPALVPFVPISSPPGWAATAADVAWVVVLLAGWRLLPDDAAARRHSRILLLLALALPAARLLVYLPWPLQFPYYSIPYLLGLAILLAFAMTRLVRAGAAARAFSVVAAAFVLAYAASGSWAQASRYFASRRLSDALVGALHSLGAAGTVDTVIVAVPRRKEQAWWGLGPTLARFGAATGRPLPPVREITCDQVAPLLQSPVPRVAVAALRWQCRLPGASSTLHATALRFADASLVTDTLFADVRTPAPPR